MNLVFDARLSIVPMNRVWSCGVHLQGLVTLFVMIGLGVVFGLPYMVAKTRKNRKNGQAGSTGPLSSILDMSRKRGHTN